MAGGLSDRIGDDSETEGSVMLDVILLFLVPSALIYCGLVLFRAWLEYRRER